MTWLSQSSANRLNIFLVYERLLSGEVLTLMAWLVTEVPAPTRATFTGARGGVTAATMVTVVVRYTRPGSFTGRPRHGGWRTGTLNDTEGRRRCSY